MPVRAAAQKAFADSGKIYKKQCFIQSISRKGNCWDNAVMERFFLNLKVERLWQNRYANHLEAPRDISRYIVEFYNTKRLHSTLGYRSPTDYEKAMPNQ